MTILITKEKLRIRVLGLVFGSIFSLGLLLGFVVFPPVFRNSISKSLNLAPGSPTRDLYLHPPFPITFNVYFFNVTNPDDIVKGGKPRLQEVGPYVFEEWKEKYNEIDNENTDCLEFTLKNKYIFRPDLTLPLTGQEVLTTPNIVVMGGIIKTIREKTDMIEFVTTGMDLIFDTPTSPFMAAKAWDMMYEGLPINCNHSEFAAKIICTVLREEAKDRVEAVTKQDLRLSMFKKVNNTPHGRFEVYRGQRNIMDLGKIVTFNDESQLDKYSEEECDKFNGTDGLIFHPFVKKSEEMWAFVPDFCRSLPVTYVQDSSYQGVETARYSLRIPGNGPNNCFCREPEICPPKGVMDMSNCMEAPIWVSKPHFYDADPEILKNLEGLSPSKEKHDTFGDFHLFTGTPLVAHRRLMFSLDMQPVLNYSIMRNLPLTPLPLFWFEEMVAMNSTVVNGIKKISFFDKANSIVSWSLMALGLVGFVVCLIKYLQAPDANMPVEKPRF